MRNFLFFISIFVIHFSLSSSECVVFLTDQNYFHRFLYTLQQLTTKGNYHGDICLIIGDDLLESKLLEHMLIVDNNVIVKHFPNFKFDDGFLEIAKSLPHFSKLFRYHKFYVFDTYFKQWDTIFYIDSGMEIYSDIRPILDSRLPGKLLAQSDAYDKYIWKLGDQFDNQFPQIKKDLAQAFNLNVDYLQTTTMLYDTSILTENMVDDLYHLTLKYPTSVTHDQGIIALYFTNIKPVWKPLPIRNETTYFYDFMKRGKTGPFIMIKYP